MKLTKKQIEKIKEMKAEGISEYVIADKFKVNQRTINYHTNEQSKKNTIQAAIKRFKNLPFKKRQEIYQKRKEYQREYRKRRYHNDPKFREKLKKTSKNYKK